VYNNNKQAATTMTSSMECNLVLFFLLADKLVTVWIFTGQPKRWRGCRGLGEETSSSIYTAIEP